MRVDDLDRARDTGAAELQLAELREIGIDWDGEPVFQTGRHAAHDAAIETLTSQGLVYECTCTRREILEAPSAPHAAPGAYPGTCRDRTDEQRRAAREAIGPRQPALRLRTPAHAREGVFDDLLLGRVTGLNDDFVLRRGDGAIAYNLAVVVDDAAMGVDQVVRGNDLASSTPRQVLLQHLLGLATPEYAHVPLVLGPTGVRLAKRDGAVTIEDLAARGVGADEVRAILARSLRLATPAEQPSMTELLDRFDATTLPKEDWVWPGLETEPAATATS